MSRPPGRSRAFRAPIHARRKCRSAPRESQALLLDRADDAGFGPRVVVRQLILLGDHFVVAGPRETQSTVEHYVRLTVALRVRLRSDPSRPQYQPDRWLGMPEARCDERASFVSTSGVAGTWFREVLRRNLPQCLSEGCSAVTTDRSKPRPQKDRSIGRLSDQCEIAFRSEWLDGMCCWSSTTFCFYERMEWPVENWRNGGPHDEPGATGLASDPPRGFTLSGSRRRP